MEIYLKNNKLVAAVIGIVVLLGVCGAALFGMSESEPAPLGVVTILDEMPEETDSVQPTDTDMEVTTTTECLDAGLPCEVTPHEELLTE